MATIESSGLLEEGEDDDSEQEEKGSDEHSGKHGGPSLIQNMQAASENSEHVELIGREIARMSKKGAPHAELTLWHELDSKRERAAGIE